MPGYPGEIWRGDQGPPPPPQVLGEYTYGGGGGRLLQRNFMRGEMQTQGDPISPTIFNVVVDDVARHWESVVAEGDGRDDRDNSSGKKWPRQRDK